MERKLFHESQGFYEKERLSNHFCTPSTIQSHYHEWLAIWLKFKNFSHAIEYGCGEGQMATSLALGFETYQLVEKSHSQKKRLSHLAAHFCDIPVFRPRTIIICQELFDAFSADMFFWRTERLFEWKIDLETRTLRAVHSDNLSALSYIQKLRDYDEEFVDNTAFSFVDYSAHKHFLTDLFSNMSADSEVLIIDYGWQWHYLRAHLYPDCPLRGFCHSELIREPWSDDRIMDLTYDIDFSYLCLIWEDLGGKVNFIKTLSQFLIDTMEESTLISHADRMLLHPLFMGSKFLVLSLSR